MINLHSKTRRTSKISIKQYYDNIFSYFSATNNGMFLEMLKPWNVFWNALNQNFSCASTIQTTFSFYYDMTFMTKMRWYTRNVINCICIK